MSAALGKRVGSTAVVSGLLALVYFVSGRLGLSLAFVNPNTTAFWPPTGIALAALLLLGYRVWPGVLLGAFLVNVSTSGNIPTSIVIAAGNTLEGLLGAYLVNRWAHGRQFVDREQDIAKFALLAGLVSTAVSATVGVTTLAVSGLAAWSDAGAVWLTWWLGDASGALIIAPLFIVWAKRPDWFSNRGRLLEAGALLLAIIGLGLIIFAGLPPFGINNYPIGYITLPLIVWAAFRFGSQGAATTTAILSSIALWGTIHGWGPFVRSAPNEALLIAQGFMATVAMTGLTLAAVVANTRQLNATLEARVSERTDQLRVQTARLETLREAERTRIAHEVHDELGGALTVIKMDVKRLAPHVVEHTPELAGRVTDLLALIDDAVQIVRRIATDLRPAVLDAFGLAAAVESHVQEFERRTGITCNLVQQGDGPEPPRDVATAVFRVLQESLTNVARHAAATDVDIHLSQLPEALLLSVRDYGQGFDASETARSTSLGLMGMRERIFAVRGSLEITSVIGEGTTVDVRIPRG